MENVYTDDWDRGSEREGFRWNRRGLGKRLGGELLGVSLYEMEPGQKSFPYHAHHGNEEFMLVLEGTVVLRTPSGETEMSRGDATLFRRGRDGLHQIINRAEGPARWLMFSSKVTPEIVEYPDSGNVGVFGHPTDEGRPELATFLDGSAERDYYHGEE